MELILIISLLMITSGMSQSGCKLRDSFPRTKHFSTAENVNYLLPDRRHSTGQLVIAPEMKFDCRGKITGWSSLTRFSSNDLAMQHLKHDITFYLWRPRPGVNGNYTFIGSKRLDFIGRKLRNGVEVVDGTKFFKFTSVQGDDDDSLHFEPGDVIGWYVHTLVQSIDVPLSVVYKNSSTTTGGSPTPFNIYSTVIANGHSGAQPPCEISIHADQTTLIRSVVPFVTVDFSTDASSQKRQVGGCISSQTVQNNSP